MAYIKITVAIFLLALAITSCERTEVELTNQDTAMASAHSPALPTG